MREEESPGPGLLHGLVGELADGLKDAAEVAANPFPPEGPRATAGPLLRVAAAVGEPSIPDGARAQARLLFEAVALIGQASWILSTAGREVAIGEGDTVTIGRSPEARLVVAHPEISKIHCEVSVRDGRLVVRDVGSTNGTEIRRSEGASPVTSPSELRVGDRLGVLDDGPEIALVGLRP